MLPVGSSEGLSSGCLCQIPHVLIIQPRYSAGLALNFATTDDIPLHVRCLQGVHVKTHLLIAKVPLANDLIHSNYK